MASDCVPNAAAFLDRVGQEGISVPQTALLLRVYTTGNATVRRLAESEGTHPSSVSRKLARLYESGLVERRDSLVDDRMVIFSVSSKGKEMIETTLLSE